MIRQKIQLFCLQHLPIGDVMFFQQLHHLRRFYNGVGFSILIILCVILMFFKMILLGLMLSVISILLRMKSNLTNVDEEEFSIKNFRTMLQLGMLRSTLREKRKKK